MLDVPPHPRSGQSIWRTRPAFVIVSSFLLHRVGDREQIRSSVEIVLDCGRRATRLRARGGQEGVFDLDAGKRRLQVVDVGPGPPAVPRTPIGALHAGVCGASAR